jgi:altronate dehydratase
MISGYLHDNRGVGIRHHQLILPSVVCSTHVARRIANEVGAVTFAHQHGCGIIGEDVQGIDDFFADLANHPNVSSVLIVGLGCETIQGQELGARLVAQNQSTRYQIIQETGGVENTVLSGVKSALSLNRENPKVVGTTHSLIVGLDIEEETDFTNQLQDSMRNIGMITVPVVHKNSSIDGFSHLMSKKAQLIISFPNGNQPASGFPLIPVLNVSSKSALHLATVEDFDLSSEDTIETFLNALHQTIQGTPTKSELNNVGEIRAPRLVRSV